MTKTFIAHEASRPDFKCDEVHDIVIFNELSILFSLSLLSIFVVSLEADSQFNYW